MRAFTLGLAATAIGLAVTHSSAHADAVDLNNLCHSKFPQDRVRCTAFVNGVIAGIKISPHPTICFPGAYDRRLSQPIVER